MKRWIVVNESKAIGCDSIGTVESVHFTKYSALKAKKNIDTIDLSVALVEMPISIRRKQHIHPSYVIHT